MRQSLGCRDSRHKCAGQELAAQSCRTRTLAMAVGGEGDWKAQSRDGGSEGLNWWRWELKQGFAGSSGHGWEGENVNGILANPLPCLYRNSMGSQRVFSAPFHWSSEIGPAAFL